MGRQYYALNVTERLGVEASGGMVRIGCAHYNTPEEIEAPGNCAARLFAESLSIPESRNDP